MFSHLAAFAAGIIVSTIGFTGVAHYADQGVAQLKAVTLEVAK